MEAPAIPTIVNVLVSLDTAGTVVNTVNRFSKILNAC
jgi:hypothetical protein